jgi:molybdopterin converting factor small subunit
LKVQVRVPTQLRDVVAGSAVVELDVDQDAGSAVSVAALLDAMAAAYPALERRIRDEQGRARPHVNVFVDSDNVRDRDGLATPIRAGEEVSIIPAVSGG